MQEIRPSGLMRGGSWLTHLGQLLPSLPPFALPISSADSVSCAPWISIVTEPASLYGTVISERDSRIAELEGQVKALTAASPRLDGGSGGHSATDTPTQSESHLDAARKYFRQ